MNSYINTINVYPSGAIETYSSINKKYIRPLSQVTDNIYLGNIYDAQNIDKLLKLGIKKVLSLITDTHQ